jgi:ribosomal protein S18 acetylase RimI-like enzyme
MAIPLSMEIRAAPVMLGLTGLSRIGRLLKQREAMDKHHKLDRPHAYLSFLGVTPQAQGHGVGSRLLASKLRELDAQGRPAYLETQTERNVALYRRHGFEVASEFRPTPDGPRQWTMWREPQA